MWLVVVSEHLVILLRLLSRLISPSGPIPEDRNYPKLVAVPMENDRHLKPRNKPFSLPYLSKPLERLALEDLLRAHPPSTHSEPQSVPLNRFFLEPLERGDHPS